MNDFKSLLNASGNPSAHSDPVEKGNREQAQMRTAALSASRVTVGEVAEHIRAGSLLPHSNGAE